MSDTLTELRDVAERPWESFRESLWRSFILVLLTGLALLACRLFHDVDSKTEPGVIMNLPDSIGDYIGFNTDVTESERVILPRDTEFAKKHRESSTKLQDGMEKTYRWVDDQMVARQAVRSLI